MTSLIEFEVVDIGKRDIVVIQYVDTEIEIFDCDGNAVFTDLKKKEGHPFYEAWEFPKSEWNEDGTAKEGGTSSGMDDAFSGPCRLIEEGCPPAKKKTKGKEKIIGAFVGYFDYKLPASYKLNQFESARLLKTSKEPPADWNAAAVWTMHRVVWEWDCCADPPKTTSIVIHDPK
jgi:hypothetical protein